MQFTNNKIPLTELNIDKKNTGCHGYINNKIMINIKM